MVRSNVWIDTVQYFNISGNSAKGKTQNLIKVQFKSIRPKGQKLYYNNNCFIVYLKHLEVHVYLY